MSTSKEPVHKRNSIPDYGSVLPKVQNTHIDNDNESFESGAPDASPEGGRLHRGLSARQVQMIAIAGTIGTGLFLGTGRSLAQGGPASMLICYTVVGFIVYVTLLLLGEMATQYPVAGSFNAYTTRFFSPSYGFALSWNYWFNDAVSVAGDLTAAQLVLSFWGVDKGWIASIVFWVFLVGVNSLHVRGYGELEYWLSSLKVVTVIIFIFIGIAVNAGHNSEHRYIGGSNWRIPGAPFVGGFGGFLRVFVTASFAFGGTESLGITAGETKNPSKNMPRVVKLVFWRIMIFYILTILLIGLNVPWNYPNLSNKSTTTSPFTIVFKEIGSNVAASFMNAVILTSVLSAGNHAMYAGTRVLYGLAVSNPPQAPKIFARTTRAGTPLFALLMTSSISALCFGSSFIGSGALWGWIQNIVGVSNQIAWLSIGLSSWRFRKAWVKQGRSIDELKFRAGWTWPWGPPFVVISVTVIILLQGWSSIIPTFSAADFVSFYVEIPIMLVMYVAWRLVRRPITARKPLVTDAEGVDASQTPIGLTTPLAGSTKVRWTTHLFDLVDYKAVNLYADEYQEEADDEADKTEARLNGKKRWLWKVYYWVV
ncbi:amino acid permease-domain-containing protein [Crepidotus variabilis]|uniref:Amino acid permease-domain-containing protein n=1 Tax=Crepidotus variabilis TaxID=179855 RepID=A0A9P6JPG8_9AGAR|nr:amino acid permease-domain-containing protein [Crepidotus variabilis]